MNSFRCDFVDVVFMEYTQSEVFFCLFVGGHITQTMRCDHRCCICMLCCHCLRHSTHISHWTADNIERFVLRLQLTLFFSFLPQIHSGYCVRIEMFFQCFACFCPFHRCRFDTNWKSSMSEKTQKRGKMLFLSLNRAFKFFDSNKNTAIKPSDFSMPIWKSQWFIDLELISLFNF